jgi:hypothetical protein
MIAAAAGFRAIAKNRTGWSLAQMSASKKIAALAVINLFVLAVAVVVAEIGFTLFWQPNYRIRCERWLVGCGMTPAGRKYWPDSTYTIESTEFHARFQTNAQGYRARTKPTRTKHPYRVAFVGDSFTEGMQVEYDKTFCALIERGLGEEWQGREVVCENYGIAATGLFEYWHRISHDVLQSQAPACLVLCIYPGNDFTGEFPADGFATDGTPLRNYYTDPSWTRHALTWLNLNSQFARYIQERIYRAWKRFEPPYEAPKLWWIDPVLTASAGGAPVVRRSRALLHAIAEECRRHGTRLCVLVVGPVTTYPSYRGDSPLALILADWKIEAPVIDVAAEALALPRFGNFLFPRDGHLNELGHAYVANAALPRLRAALEGPMGPLPGHASR